MAGRSCKDPAAVGVQSPVFKSGSQMKPAKMGVNVWTIVKPKMQVKQRNPLLNAIVIESRGDISYVEILRRDLTLSGQGDNVTRMRRM